MSTDPLAVPAPLSNVVQEAAPRIDWGTVCAIVNALREAATHAHVDDYGNFSTTHGKERPGYYSGQIKLLCFSEGIEP